MTPLSRNPRKPTYLLQGDQIVRPDGATETITENTAAWQDGAVTHIMPFAEWNASYAPRARSLRERIRGWFS